jgi:glycosyltransferase involved in cell wall biosynthesis
MSYVIFGDNFSFPEGDAATNRVHTYAKGFTESGKKVYVICFLSEYNSVKDGSIKETSFYYPFEGRSRNKYFLIRRWNNLRKYINTIKYLANINKTEKVEAIIVYSTILGTHLFSWCLALLFKCKLIKESSEHPLRSYQKGKINKKIGLLKLQIESNLNDGIFCISNFLHSFYVGYGISSDKLFLVPSTVDPSRFRLTGESPFKLKYIGYFGGLTFTRDSIGTLIKAFASISPKNPEIYLVIGGFCTNAEKEKLVDLINEVKITDKVILLDYLPRQEIIRYITFADILIMVRGKDIESAASFPSKLTEYLSTAKPVITVDVGEVTNYLQDNDNCFIVKPENHKELADKIDYVLNNYDNALEIASKGAQLTLSIFNYNYQAKRMISFIQSIKER